MASEPTYYLVTHLNTVSIELKVREKWSCLELTIYLPKIVPYAHYKVTLLYLSINLQC